MTISGTLYGDSLSMMLRKKSMSNDFKQLQREIDPRPQSVYDLGNLFKEKNKKLKTQNYL